MAEFIKLVGLTKRFGDLLAVDDISLSVEAGQVLGFLGPNGAGKTTTMRMVAGFMEPTEGTAVVCGHDVIGDPVGVRRNIGFLPEGAPTYGDMMVRSYLEFIAEIRGFDGGEKRRRVRRMVEMVALEGVMHQRIETLSKGYKRRVGLAQSLLHDPPVLILDEPTDGLDPNQKRHVRDLIREMSTDKAIVISTHILEEVDAVCDRAVVIARGQIKADGTPEELRARAKGHNAVILSVPEGQVGTIEEVGKIEGVGSIELLSDKEGSVRCRIVSTDRRNLAPQISDWLRGRSIPFDEMVVERGSLDDVFHSITEGDDDA
ncbi:MAG: putative ABC transporter ATP-binding protein YxlF [Alphaproteobacteria bacterium MarineAlpha4_Bin2]|nr:MAG: putative ABC transporter ATP-binding protein YxlF [Alphaproteobacteria bacterium MarineAlpha4_Bin2]